MEIPKMFMGRKREPGAIERVLNSASKTSPDTNSVNAPNLGIAKINPREYIQLGIDGLHGTPAVISAYELAGSNNMNYENTHKFLLEKGLYMPTPKIFMTHFKNVIEAKKGNRALNYVDGTQVPNTEVDELFKHLTTNYKDIFASGNPGAWTWLNAKFIGGNIETVTGMNPNKDLIMSSSQLESCLTEDKLASLDVNGQGLSNKPASGKKYKAGENVFFYYPREGCVAWFGANSNGAGLSCGRDPADTDAGLGVFACAEGATPKNKRRKT